MVRVRVRVWVRVWVWVWVRVKVRIRVRNRGGTRVRGDVAYVEWKGGGGGPRSGWCRARC